MAKVSSFVRRLAQEQRDGKVVKVSSSWNSSRSKVSEFVRRKAEEERQKKTTVPSFTEQEGASGAFADGYQFGDLSKTWNATSQDLKLSFLEGIAGLGEGVTDLALYGVSGAAKLLGAKDFATKVKNVAAENSVNGFFDKIRETSVGDNSVAGETANSVASGLGQVAGIILTGGAGKAAGLGAKAVSALTTGTMFASSTGSGISEAYQGDATDGEALAYGVMKGAVDAGSELLFGGLGKTVGALGLSKGISSLDDMFAKKLSSKISSHFFKTLVQAGVKASAEGAEEVLAGIGTAVAKDLTYMSEKDLRELIEDENLLEQFVVGAITSGIAQGGDVVTAVKQKTDLVSGLTKNEQAVVDKVYKDRVAQEEKSGKVTQARKSKIYDEVLSDMDKGRISTDTIEEILGKDALSQYDSLSKEAEEFKTLYETEGGKLSEKQKDRLAELKAKNQANAYEGLLKSERAKISQNVADMVKADRLSESYNEQGRKSQKFEADVSQYNAKQRQTIQNAIDSGILNNTNRTHEFVDLIARISADKGVAFDFADNAKLKETGFALDGVTVNGFVNENGVTVNVNSAKALNSVVGHEITHVLEGTELYNSLAQAITEYAKSKGEYDSRLAQLTKLYEGRNANIEQEVVADLVGDYLFTDTDFVNRLSTEHRNVFEKIFDEIKYLCRIATAGSKEARQLEKVKKTFEEAYRTETKNPTTEGGVRYSIVNLDTGKSYVQASRQVIHGDSVSEWRSQISEFFNNALKKGPIEIETIEGDVLTISKRTAEKARAKTATENGISRELTDKEFLVKLHAEAHIDELAEISRKNRRPPVPDGKNHSFAKDGFTYRTVYFQDFDGSYYKVTLSVGENNGVSTVYNVGKIKADDIPDGKIISTIGSKADMSSTKLSISPESGNVNTKNSLSNQQADDLFPLPGNTYGKDIALFPLPPGYQEQSITANTEDTKPIQEVLAEGASIRGQLRNNQAALSTMQPVAEIRVPAEYAQMDIAGKKNWVAEKLRPTGYKVERKGFGIIDFAKKRLKSAFNYFDKNSAEEAAFEALPYVLENGMEISGHNNHKDRNYETVTLAAPITINGKRGNMAAVVKRSDGNYYKVHRILTPDGSVFNLPEMANEAESTPAGGVTENGSLATPKDSASVTSISKDGSVVNQETVGAAPSGFDPASHLQYEYGSLPEGENAIREDSLPKSTTGKDRVSLTARTVKGAEATPDELVDLLDRETVEGKLSYLPIKNDATVKAAYEAIVREGWEAAKYKWEADVRAGKVSAELSATGALLLNNAAKAGDKKAWLDILHDYQIMGTNAGQAVQALRILKTLSPDDSLYMIERSISQMVADMKLGTDIKIDETLQQRYRDAKTDAEREATRKEIAAQVARQIPSTAMDKWTALRYLNMLGNLRTQGRNILGNLGMSVTSGVKNTVATAIEAIAEKASGGKFHRTKSLFVGKDLLNAAKNDFVNVESVALNGGKFNDPMAKSIQFQQEVQDARKIFKFVPLEKYRRATNWSMNSGDLVFSKAAYGRALAGYLKANGIAETDFLKVDPQILDEARGYAVKQAQEQTFRDSNWLSGWVSKMGRRNDTPSVGKLLSEGVMPFRKTPANILIRAEEYSPLGLVNATVKSIQAAKGKGGVTGAEVVNSWAKALTGTGLFGLGMLLSSLGVLSGGPDEDNNKEWFEDQYGWQNYAIHIGDINFTIDFLSPEAMPLLMGAQMMELMQDGGIELKEIESALLSIADPMIEMSMLQGVNDTLDNIRYAESNMGQFLVNAGVSYLTQGLTNSLLGQFERSFEGQRMSTYVDKDSSLPDWLQKALGKASAKTPGLDYNQIPYINAWGEEETSNPLFAFLENAMSPAYVEQGRTDAVYTELNRLNDAQSDINVYPQTPDKTLTFDDADGVRHENYNLSADEYVQLAKLQGQTQKKLVEDIISSDLYNELTDQEKAKAIQLAYTYSKEYSRQKVLNSDGFSAEWMGEVSGSLVEAIISHTSEERTFSYKYPGKYALSQAVGGYDSYKTYRAELNKIESDKNKDGKTISNSRKPKVVDYINNLDAEYGEKIILYVSEFNSKESRHTYGYEIVDYLNSRSDISYSQMEAILIELGFKVGNDGRVTW